jgi:hypothetical protein
MSIRRYLTTAAAVVVLSTAAAGAQKPLPVRQIGRLERASSDSLASVAAALPMSDGRVLVNDITAHRLLLFDSTLTHASVVADTTSATANAYGRSAGTLIRYRGDTALFIDPASLSMLVVDPAGKIARVMAVPRPDDAQSLIGSVFGTPGFDARGRLVYYSPAGMEGLFMLCCVGTSRLPDPPRPPVQKPESAFVIRVDLATRIVDTATTVRIANPKSKVMTDADRWVKSIMTTTNPIPIVDDWAVMPDGSIAVVRGLDYHVDWIAPDGTVSSSPKVPFEWQPVNDARKAALIDSSVKAEQATLDATYASISRASGGRAGTGGGGGRGAGNGGGRGGGLPIPFVAGRPEPSDLADYMPAFKRGDVTPDANGRLWIRTTTLLSAQPVYDIVNRRGELVDRVQLPPFRTIAGFGPGVIYMAVKDSAGIVRLERARVK